MTWLILLAIIAAIIFWAVAVYNALVQLRNQADEGWSGIDVQLKRRYNLIPNLIETVKGYQKHEKGVFEEVTQLRSRAMKTSDIDEKGPAESALTLGLGKLFAVAENYPELKANVNFLDLQKNLNEIEDEIQLARRYYNGTVRNYNTKIQSFPDMIIAKQFAFTAKPFFEITEEAEKAVPKVSFD